MDSAEPKQLRLHLGCGGTYLEGYRNIDLPPENHGVQEGIRPDEFADITQLDYRANSVDEIRLHHVFEHFERPTALRLLIDWHTFLRPGGLLWIETPDFRRSALAFLLRPTSGSRLKVLRHLYGSQEANWAAHKDGWYAGRFRHHLEALGFDRVKCRRTRWRGTFNLHVTARKAAAPLSREELVVRAESLLRLSLVDDGESERRILAEWMRELGSTQKK